MRLEVLVMKSVKQIDIYDWLKQQSETTTAKGKASKRLVRNELNTMEHEILGLIVSRPVATEELMERYDLERVEVRKHIKRIRRLKTGHAMIMNCQVVYNGKKCYGYSTSGDDLLYKRWVSATKTALLNNPFLINKMFKTLKDMEKPTDDLRLAQNQTKMKFNGWERDTVDFHNDKTAVKEEE